MRPDNGLHTRRHNRILNHGNQGLQDNRVERENSKCIVLYGVATEAFLLLLYKELEPMVNKSGCTVRLDHVAVNDLRRVMALFSEAREVPVE